MTLALLYWWGYPGPSSDATQSQHPETHCQYPNETEPKANGAPSNALVILCFQSYAAPETDGAASENDKIPQGAILLSRLVARRVVSDPIALFSIILALFTWRLIIVGRDQHGAAMKAIKLSRDEFLATHRPKIILREAIIASVLEGQPIEVLFSLANVGDSPGTIVRSVVDLDVHDPNTERLFLFNSVEPFNEIGDLTLAPGQQRIIPFSTLAKRPRAAPAPKWEESKFALPFGVPLTDRSGDPVTESRSYRAAVIHLVGQFLYADSDGAVFRRTAFRRELIPERQRFYRIRGEPDVDYTD